MPALIKQEITPDRRKLYHNLDDDIEQAADASSASDADHKDTFGSRAKRILPVALPGLILMIVIPSAIASIDHNSFAFGGLYGCDPDRRIWVAGAKQYSSLSVWNFSYTLSITVPLRKFKDISGVKTFDIFWDLVVGRGYQALSAVFVYKVFRVVMADYMEAEALPQDHFIAIQYSTTSPLALWAYIAGCRGRTQRHAKAASSVPRSIMALLIFSAAYVLAAPTWLAAMTGYQALAQPLFLWDTNYIPFTKLQACRYAIVDGHRLGLEDNHCVLDNTLWAKAVQDYTSTQPGLACYPRYNPNGAFFSSHERFMGRESCDSGSTFELTGNITQLEAPVLTIERGWFLYKDRVLTGQYLIQNSTCNPLDGYVWGFSFILLFSFMVATTLLTFSLVWTWCKYCNRVWPGQVDMLFGDIRAALAITASVHERLHAEADEMTESELQESLSARNAGVKQKHARSNVMKRAGPRSYIVNNNLATFAVGSEGYTAYLRQGLRSLEPALLPSVVREHLQSQRNPPLTRGSPSYHRSRRK